MSTDSGRWTLQPNSANTASSDLPVEHPARSAGISVIVSTFGDPVKWGEMAHRALTSAYLQDLEAEGVYYNHGDSLHEARNIGASQAQGEWLCFLDADDELDQHYIAAMWEKVGELDGPWLVQPSTLGVVDGREDPYPVVIPAKNLVPEGNYMVIGTLVRRDQFLRVGGFRDLDYAEDWDLWIRCVLDGASCTPQPDAIYRVHVNPAGRNSGERNAQVRIFGEIVTTYSGRWNQMRRQWRHV